MLTWRQSFEVESPQTRVSRTLDLKALPPVLYPQGPHALNATMQRTTLVPHPSHVLDDERLQSGKEITLIS